MAAKDNSIFTQIKEKVPLDDYLIHHLDVDLVPDGAGRMKALCPFHDETTPSFKVTDSDDGIQTWRCYGSCSTGGTVIDAVLKSEDFDIPFEAVTYLNELYDLGLNLNDESYKHYATNIAQTKEQITQDKELMDDREARLSKIAHKYLKNRGYSEETIEHFSLAVDNSQSKNGRLSIPIYDKTNHPISIANRALFDSTKCANCHKVITSKEVVSRRFKAQRAEKNNEEPIEWESCPECGAPNEKAKIAWLIKQHPKYLFLGSFDKSHHLYNQWNARKFLSGNPDAAGLFLVEGYADAWAGHQAGHEAICSYNGAQLSNWQAEEAVELAKKFEKPIILIPDFDLTGHLNISKNIAKLRTADPTVEIDIIHSIDKLTYNDSNGNPKPCKDLGEVLQHFNNKQVSRVLDENRWPAAEWQIRQVIEKRNSRTGAPFHSEVDQLRLVSEVLSSNKSKVALDHLINYLAVEWEKDPDTIRNWFYSEISSDNATSYKHLFKDINQARNESRDFLKDDNVIPLGFDVLDQCFPGNGARPGQLFMALGKSGTGKAQPLDALVLTTSGYKQMGEISIGEELVDPVGGTTKVVGVFPQGEREIYKLKFSDGSETECDGEHLWKIKDSNNRWKVKTLQEIIDHVDIVKSPHKIPVTKPVSFPERDLPLDPYLLGILIGDGTFVNSSPILTTADREVIESVSRLLPDGVITQELAGSSKGYEYILASGKRGGKENPLTRILRDLGLWGVFSKEKFIPKEYLESSIQDRLALLRGLMDSDGSCMLLENRDRMSSHAEFSTVSSHLADDMVWLVRSLGGVSKARRSSASYLPQGEPVKCSDRYRLSVSLPPEINPFQLDRKASSWKRVLSPTRRLVDINYVGKKQAQCIAVSSPDQLYITDNFIVTHNTMLATQILSNMAETGVRSIFFSLEQAAKSLFPRLVCQALDVNMDEAERLIRSDEQEDEDLLDPVRETYKNMLIIDNVPTENREAQSMTPKRVQAVVQEANLTHFKDAPANVVVIDHLGILDVDSDAPSDIRGSDLMAPGFIMQRLFAIAKSTNTLMFILQQLPKEIPPGKAFGYDAGRGGSKQTDFCDAIFCIWRPEQDIELDDEGRGAVAGQYKLALGKNRYGGSAVAHLFFDKSSLRIMPPLQVVQPDHINPDGPVIEVDDREDGETLFPSEKAELEGSVVEETPKVEIAQSEKTENSGGILSSEEMDRLAQETDPIPDDTQALLDSIGAKPVDDEEGPDPALQSWFD